MPLPSFTRFADPSTAHGLDASSFEREASQATATYPEQRPDGSVWEITYHPADDSIVSERMVSGPPQEPFQQAVSQYRDTGEGESEQQAPAWYTPQPATPGAGLGQYMPEGESEEVEGIAPDSFQMAFREHQQQQAKGPDPLEQFMFEQGPETAASFIPGATSAIRAIKGEPLVQGEGAWKALDIAGQAADFLPFAGAGVKGVKAGAKAIKAATNAPPTFYHGTQPGKLGPTDVPTPQGREPAFVTRNRNVARDMGGPELHEYNVAEDAKVLDLTDRPEAETIQFLAELKKDKTLMEALQSLGYDVVHATPNETMVVNPAMLRPKGAGRQGVKQLVGAEEGFLRLDPGDIGGPTPPPAAVPGGNPSAASGQAPSQATGLPPSQGRGNNMARQLWREYDLADPASDQELGDLYGRVSQLFAKGQPDLDEIENLGVELANAVSRRTTLEQRLGASIEQVKTAKANAPPKAGATTTPPVQPKGTGPKIGETMMDIANIPRALRSSFDISAPLRQGAYFLPSRPTEWVKAFGSMIKAVGSEKYAQSVEDAIIKSPHYDLARQSGVYFAPRGSGSKFALNQKEEAFMSKIASKLPWVKASERAYTTFLNKLRMEVFETISKEWDEVGGRPAEDSESLANFVNAGTGRGRLGPLSSSGPALNALFFSPRFFASRIENVTALADPAIRGQAANALWKFYGTGATVLALAAAAGADVEFDPRSSDFGKVRIGNTRYDFWSGYQPIARYLSQLVSGQAKPVSGPNAGQVGDKERIRIIGDFLRSKLAPLPSASVTGLAGKDFLGNEANVGHFSWDLIAPIFLQDLWQAGQEEGMIGVGKTLPSSLGLGVQTFGSSDSFPASSSGGGSRFSSGTSRFR